MAIVSLNTIKNWFKTGLIPTQTQFWDTWDSFWHKGESIPASSVSGLDNLLQSKTDDAEFEAHVNDPNAHGIQTLQTVTENEAITDITIEGNAGFKTQQENYELRLATPYGSPNLGQLHFRTKGDGTDGFTGEFEININPEEGIGISSRNADNTVSTWMSQNHNQMTIGHIAPDNQTIALFDIEKLKLEQKSFHLTKEVGNEALIIKSTNAFSEIENVSTVIINQGDETQSFQMNHPAGNMAMNHQNFNCTDASGNNYFDLSTQNGLDVYGYEENPENPSSTHEYWLNITKGSGVISVKKYQNNGSSDISETTNIELSPQPLSTTYPAMKIGTHRRNDTTGEHISGAHIEFYNHSLKFRKVTDDFGSHFDFARFGNVNGLGDTVVRLGDASNIGNSTHLTIDDENESMTLKSKNVLLTSSDFAAKIEIREQSGTYKAGILAPGGTFLASELAPFNLKANGTYSVNLVTDQMTDHDKVQKFIDAEGYIPVVGGAAPSSATDTGKLGEIRVPGDGYAYFCVAADTWVRAAVSSW